MEKEKLIKLFDYLNGRQHSAETIKTEIATVNPNLGNEFYEKLNSETFDAHGGFKSCVYWGDKKVFAMLKSKTPYCREAIDETNKISNELLKLNRRFIAHDVLTPKIYSMFFADERYIEIQKRVVGEPIALIRTSSLQTKSGEQIDDDYAYQKIYEHNINMQQTLLKAPQEQFNELFKSFVILNGFGFSVEDSHGENIMYGEKGFSIIDLNYYDYYQRETHYVYNEPPSMTSCVYDFVKAFSYSNDSHFSLLQQAKIKRNNIKVLSKLFAAVGSQHTGIDINSLEYPLRRMFGDSWKRCAREALKPRSFSIFKM